MLKEVEKNKGGELIFRDTQKYPQTLLSRLTEVKVMDNYSGERIIGYPSAVAFERVNKLSGKVIEIRIYKQS
jgi:hypothetical protein